MIITRTPVRISLLGGGTDFPDSIYRWGGCVVGFAINKYSYITCRRIPRLFDYQSRLMYSKIETVKSNKDIEHRAINACVRACGCSNMPLEISHMGDLPGQSGTGSSSTFIVGLVNGLTALCGERLTPYELYENAIRIEQDMLGERVGCQDQAWAAFGGLNQITFPACGHRIQVNPILQPQDEMQDMLNHFMMFFTGINRTSSTIAEAYVPSLREKEVEHRTLLRLAHEGVALIKEGAYGKLGRLLDESWEIKKSFSNKVTNPRIDEIYGRALDAGATGGKLMGAGGGGCMLLCVPPHKREKVKEALDGVLHIPFKIEPLGSKIIFNDGDTHA